MLPLWPWMLVGLWRDWSATPRLGSNGGFDPAPNTIVVNVTPVSDGAPAAAADAYITTVGTPIVITQAQLLSNDFLPDHARLTGNTVGSIRNVAVAALTKNLADELGPAGINVTVVHPGVTRTERTPELLAYRAGQTTSIKLIEIVAEELLEPEALAENDYAGADAREGDEVLIDQDAVRAGASDLRWFRSRAGAHRVFRLPASPRAGSRRCRRERCGRF